MELWISGGLRCCNPYTSLVESGGAADTDSGTIVLDTERDRVGRACFGSDEVTRRGRCGSCDMSVKEFSL